MNRIDERVSQILARSEKLIAAKKRRRKRLLLTCIPVLLLCAVCIPLLNSGAGGNKEVPRSGGAGGTAEMQIESAAIPAQPPQYSADGTGTDANLAGIGAFRADYFRTNGGREGAQYPRSYIFTDRQMLDAYLAENGGYYSFEDELTDPSTESAGFMAACRRYDEAYFKNAALIAVVVEEGSGSVRHRVESVKLQNNILSIRLLRQTPEVFTCDMAQWHILIEVGRLSVNEAVKVEVNITDEP